MSEKARVAVAMEKRSVGTMATGAIIEILKMILTLVLANKSLLDKLLDMLEESGVEVLAFAANIIRKLLDIPDDEIVSARLRDDIVSDLINMIIEAVLSNPIIIDAILDLIEDSDNTILNYLAWAIRKILNVPDND